MMEDRFADLLDHVAKTVTEKLLEDQFPLGKENEFFHDPSVGLQVINALIDQLEVQTEHAGIASKLLTSEIERTAFDKQLRRRVYDAEANRILKRMDDKAYKTAVSRMNDEADRLKTEITNLRLKLRGEAEKKQWVSWVKNFGQEIDAKKSLTDEQRQLYLKGLIEKIEAKFDAKTREHQLEIHFQHPIVGD